MLTLDDVALFRCFPGLRGKIPWMRLGSWPTPIEPLVGLAGARVPVLVKREDLSSPRYGGNKVRTLEAMLGRAVAASAERVWATGAYGSNHATATVLHAGAAGLSAGVALFPQRASTAARDNLAAMLSCSPRIAPMRSVIELPFVMARLRRADPRAFVMAPGAASPEGALGALSAALELAEQVAEGVCPPPERIVLAVGSTCTTAGLLAGLFVAESLGIGFGRRTPAPAVHAVRVTPWPITSPLRIAHLAQRTSAYLAALSGAPEASLLRMRRALTVDERFFGGSYGRATASGYRVTCAFRQTGGPPLDVVYSAKSAAALLELARSGRGPVLFWATKSSAPLPRPSASDLARAPRSMRRWLGGHADSDAG